MRIHKNVKFYIKAGLKSKNKSFVDPENTFIPFMFYVTDSVFLF